MDMIEKEKQLLEKGYSIDTIMSLCRYKEEELNNAVNRAVDVLTSGVSSVNNPKCIFIGGQPGVGKSVLSDKLKRSSNSVEISMDACRSFHPHYKEIEDTIREFYKNKTLSKENNPGHDMALFTQYFAGNMANVLTDKISDMKYNILMEWNMRNPKDVLTCMKNLRDKGYINEAIVLTIDKEKSFEASQIRADVMEQDGCIARRVNEEFHQVCLDTIPRSVDIIYEVGKEQNILNDMKVMLRNGKVIWDNENTLPSKIIEEYYNNKELSKQFNNNPEWAKIALGKELIGLTIKGERKLVA